jgi:hypothetical protein
MVWGHFQVLLEGLAPSWVPFDWSALPWVSL